MPSKIPMTARFMFWANKKSLLLPDLPTGDILAIPYPASGAFESARTVRTQESANGEVIGQIVGRTRHKQNMTWNVMDCEKWWEINRWLENNIKTEGNFAFYCKMFNFNLGYWEIHQCYVGNPSCTPFAVDSNPDSPTFGSPRFLRNCTLNVIDCGIVEEE